MDITDAASTTEEPSPSNGQPAAAAASSSVRFTPSYASKKQAIAASTTPLPCRVIVHDTLIPPKSEEERRARAARVAALAAYRPEGMSAGVSTATRILMGDVSADANAEGGVSSSSSSSHAASSLLASGNNSSRNQAHSLPTPPPPPALHLHLLLTPLLSPPSLPPSLHSPSTW